MRAGRGSQKTSAYEAGAGGRCSVIIMWVVAHFKTWDLKEGGESEASGQTRLLMLVSARLGILGQECSHSFNCNFFSRWLP
jgi:hypothetical protein